MPPKANVYKKGSPRASATRAHRSSLLQDPLKAPAEKILRKRNLDTPRSAAERRRTSPPSAVTAAPASSTPLRRSARLREPPPLKQTSDQVISSHSAKPAASKTAKAAPPAAVDAAADQTPAQPRPERAPLTEHNLKKWTKMANRKRKHEDPTVTTSTSKSRSSTSTGFELRAARNGVLDRVKSKAPTNLEPDFERLTRRRDTASPPESEWNKYVHGVEFATNEASMIDVTGRLLIDPLDRSDRDGFDGYTRARDQAMTGYPENVGFNNGLSLPQPDLMEGFVADSFDPFPVDDVLGGSAVLIKDVPYPITLPHLLGEYKGPGKDMRKARTQAAYGGAALVYGRNKALEYIGEPDPKGHASVTTFTSDGTALNFYAHYADTAGRADAGSSSHDSQVQYHQYPRASFNMTDSHEEWKKGRRFLRNVQDDARDKALDLRERLQRRWAEEDRQRNGVAAEAEPANTNDLEHGGHGVVNGDAMPTPSYSSFKSGRKDKGKGRANGGSIAEPRYESEASSSHGSNRYPKRTRK